MKARILAGMAFVSALAACASGPQTGAVPAVAACAVRIEENAAYIQQHVEARTERLKVIRFASEEAMNAYNYETNIFTIRGIELAGMRKMLARQYGLSSDTAEYTFEDTTDEEATARFEAGEACAGPLIG